MIETKENTRNSFTPMDIFKRFDDFLSDGDSLIFLNKHEERLKRQKKKFRFTNSLDVEHC